MTLSQFCNQLVQLISIQITQLALSKVFSWHSGIRWTKILRIRVSVETSLKKLNLALLTLDQFSKKSWLLEHTLTSYHPAVLTTDAQFAHWWSLHVLTKSLIESSALSLDDNKIYIWPAVSLIKPSVNAARGKPDSATNDWRVTTTTMVAKWGRVLCFPCHTKLNYIRIEAPFL